MLLVTAQVNVFAARSASPGALYTFTSHGLGNRWGALSGWSLLLAYIFTASATIAGFTNYVGVILDSVFHVPLGTGAGLTLMAASAALCWWIACRDIQLSTRAMLLLEFASVGLIIFLSVLFFMHAGTLSDSSQLMVTGTTAQGLRMALVLALFSFVGFESATALGGEAKDPLKSIPKSVLLSVLMVGVFFTAIAYTLVLAFHGIATPLDKAMSPLVDLANASQFPSLGLPLAFGALIGQFACMLASITAAARVMYSMSHDGFLHSMARDVHETHSTPHVAVTASLLVAAVGPLLLLVMHVGALDIFGYLGTVATFGFLLSYMLVSIAAPVYLSQRKELRPIHLVTSVITILMLLVPIVGSVYPVPDAPYSYLPYVFVGLMVLGAFRIFRMEEKAEPVPSIAVSE
jgi:amino acid transporter